MIVGTYTYILWAITILILPMNWIISIVLAILIHECCHIGAVYALGGRIVGIRVGISGILLETETMTTWRNFLASAAGPAGSLLLMLTITKFPRLGLCGMFHGIYNLLPIYPLDGGRMIEAVHEHFYPMKNIHKKTKWDKCIMIASSVVIILLAICFRFPGILLVLLPVLKEKYLAKKLEKGYNKATIEMR